MKMRNVRIDNVDCMRLISFRSLDDYDDGGLYWASCTSENIHSEHNTEPERQEYERPGNSKQE